MSLTTKALDRLLARVVDKIAGATVGASFPVHPQDARAAIDRAAKERIAALFSDEDVVHRLTDACDYTVAGHFEQTDFRKSLNAKIENKLDEAVEDAVEQHTREIQRDLERAAELVDVDDIAQTAVENACDFEAAAKEACEDALREAGIDFKRVVEDHVAEAIDQAVAKRAGALDGEVGWHLAATEAVDLAVTKIVAAANAKLESGA